MQEELIEWINQELEDRGWSVRELARRAGVSHGSINNILNGLRKPGPDVCMAIARAFHVPPETVFRRAGLLPTVSDDDADLNSQILDIMRNLNRQDREEILRYALMRYEAARKSAAPQKITPEPSES